MSTAFIIVVTVLIITVLIVCTMGCIAIMGQERHEQHLCIYVYVQSYDVTIMPNSLKFN